jgi:hypothetical protein
MRLPANLLYSNGEKHEKNAKKMLKSRENAAQPPFSVCGTRGYAASAVAGQV